MKKILTSAFLAAALPFISFLPSIKAQQNNDTVSAFKTASTSIKNFPQGEDNKKFWRDSETGLIIKTWRCPETKICGFIYDIDAKNKKMLGLTAFVLNKEFSKKQIMENEITENHTHRLCGFGTDVGSKGGLELFNMVADNSGVNVSGKTRVALDIPRGKGKNYGFFVFNFTLEDKGDAMEAEVWWNAGGGPFSWISKKGLGKHRTLISVPQPSTPACVAPAL